LKIQSVIVDTKVQSPFKDNLFTLARKSRQGEKVAKRDYNLKIQSEKTDTFAGFL